MLLEKSLAKGNKNMTKENLRQLAGDKFRSIGWSGQPQIIGHEYEFKTKTFSELEIPIPASHWTPNRLDLETVHSEELPQTCSLGTEANETTQYGRIRVNRTAIISMFPQ